MSAVKLRYAHIWQDPRRKGRARHAERGTNREELVLSPDYSHVITITKRYIYIGYRELVLSPDYSHVITMLIELCYMLATLEFTQESASTCLISKLARALVLVL